MKNEVDSGRKRRDGEKVSAEEMDIFSHCPACSGRISD
jgi:hypothetical protein